ncbi:hypothetical protein OEA41_003627 [Lepraria neglecta]|uniref:Ceramide glucosyltransferase n=1 Tax=Lepraria neglecta TaxID=209136 RepID=A0AAD9Z673_9LECA|nr:hypothetical protein OEA41_003627 [Lepraria neglecta]
MRAPAKSVSNTLTLAAVPHVTIIRPIKGIEPYLYECLASTFHQTYPRERLTIYFCISSRNDPSLTILEHLVAEFSTFDVKILVEDEDPNLSGRDGRTTNLGPNPKIRNMSRAYREAKGDIVWIIDCNVWISPSVAGRMVDLLYGFTPTAPGRRYKFVHQLPLVIDVQSPVPTGSAGSEFLSSGPDSAFPIPKTGGMLEELFLSTSHAKFYTAIATVAIAPCTVGKSNMFRRSHLNALTSNLSASHNSSGIGKGGNKDRGPGIDFFSDNICEDHLIGDLLWRSPVPAHVRKIAGSEGHELDDPAHFPAALANKFTWGNHGLLPPHPSNLATQPTSRMSLTTYIDRRTRWLRVRKFTVRLATLVEPGTESLLCSLYGAYGLTTLPWCNRVLSIPKTWLAFWTIWLLSVMFWAATDRYTWTLLQHGGTSPSERPVFGRTRGARRPLGQWILAWLGREILAFPIWCWAVWGGVTVVWRGRKFWVGTDMKVHEIVSKTSQNGHAGGQKNRNGNGQVRVPSCIRMWEEHGGGLGREVDEEKDRVKDD